MKYAYPQDPTHAVSAIRRYDESSDSSTSQSSLERQQDIAVVGETVPMIFCHRFNWGGTLGTNGGVWISPRLIQLGVETTNLSMMYLLSQGKVTGLQTANTYWGYQKLTGVDSSAQMCYAYEAVPACLDLDYDPGGSLSWTTTQTSGGPSLSGSGGSFSTTNNVIKLVITFSANIQVSGSGQIVGGYAGSQMFRYGSWMIAPWPQDPKTITQDDEPRNSPNQQYFRDLYNSGSKTYYPPKPGQNAGYTDSLFSFGSYHRSASWNQTSEVRYNWRVRNQATNQVVKSGQVWIRHGTSSLTISGLPQGQYQLEFDSLYKERNAGYSTYSIPTPNPVHVASAWVRVKNGIQNPGSPGNGFRRHTTVGSETQNITTSITQTILNVIEFPDLPGGDQQIVGGLSDLTMMGIAGDITLLRPQDGPDYFIQSHIFVEQGIEVERLTWGGTGSSPFYGDLVNYLMNSTQVLKPDQIDRDSLILANRLNERYDMYFNGVLQTTNSLAEWMTRTAPYFLLTPRQVDGKYGLWPVCPVNSANELSRDRTVPVLTVTRDDIVQGSYGRSYISVKDRRPVCLVMVYRDQPNDNVGQTVTVEVRYPGTALTGPFESHDLTEFCCRAEQAVYAARYILAKRRYTTHTVSFTMARRAAQLKPGDIIKVDLALDTTDGAGITDAIFYQIESLSEGQGGSVAIEATHFPTFGNDVSLVAYETHQGNVSIQ
nr:unnamed protein product [uncultured Mediterranean phage uvMED]